jgi:hypothetical protein
MPRNNKVTGRVFAEIAETSRRKGAYEKFLAIDQEMGFQEMGFQESEKLKEIKEKYSTLVQECADDIKILAALEEIITQIRAKEAINTELRLSLSRDYIYARSSFYRKDNKINDIRIVVGKVDEYGDELDELINDTNFRILCKEKVIEAMDKEININITNLNLIYANEETKRF